MAKLRTQGNRYTTVEMDGKVPRIDPAATVLDGVTLVGDVVLAPDVNVWYGSILRGDIESIRIGARSNIQDGTVIHVAHGLPCLVGEDVTVGHRALLHACTVEDRVLVGMGAVVLDGAVIGHDSVVAAGAVVRPGTRIPPRSLVAGVPAKIRRTLEPHEVEQLRSSATAYLEYAAHAQNGDLFRHETSVE